MVFYTFYIPGITCLILLNKTMGDSYFVPLVATVSVFVIAYALLIFSAVNISVSLFNPTFLRRTADIDERMVCRKLKFNPTIIERGRRLSLDSSLLLVTTTDNPQRDCPQIMQHLTVFCSIFREVKLVIVTPSNQGFPPGPSNAVVEVKVVESEYGGSSRESFNMFRRQWEERYSLFYQNSHQYLVTMDMDFPGRIFKKGILESVAYLGKGGRAIGFRTITPTGKTRPDTPWYIPETLPYGKGLVKSDSWEMGIYKLPLGDVEKYVNTNMIYLRG
jgi:hypothetical protein